MFLGAHAFSQEKAKVGIITNPHFFRLQGTHIINLQSNIGTKADENGVFTIPVSENDTLLFSHVGYKRKFLRITPFLFSEDTLHIKMELDSIYLKQFDVFPYRTYEEFKKAFKEIKIYHKELVIEGTQRRDPDPNFKPQPTIFNPVSLIYDRFFDKQAKKKRKLERYRAIINAEEEINVKP